MQIFAAAKDVLALKYYIVLSAIAPFPKDRNSPELLLAEKKKPAEHNSRDPQSLTHSIVSQHFMELEGSVPNSQELSTCPYPESDQSSPHHPFPLLQDPS
jgi:hypothetical protein